MVSAKDQAGNQSSQIESLYIDQAEPKVKISGADAYMITSRPVTALYEIAEENLLSEFAADTQWENVSGKKMVLPVPEWEKTEAGKKSEPNIDRGWNLSNSCYCEGSSRI